MSSHAHEPRSRPLRILLVIESAGGGSGRHVLDLAHGLVTLGHEVHLAWSPDRAEPGFMHSVAAMPAVRSHRVGMRRAPGPSDVTAALALRRLIRTAGPFDIVHGHSSKAGALARLAAIGLHLPVIYTPHALVTMDFGLGQVRHAAYRAAELALAPLGARIICVSGEERDHALALGIGAPKLAVIPNGIAALPPADRATMRAQLRLDAATPCVGFVGRLSAQKAVGRLVQAFASATGDRTARLVIAGEGPDGPGLESLAGELGIADRVTFTGHVDGAGMMAAFDLFVLPSRYEAFPYVLLEAVARGLPIISTAVGGADAVVVDGVNGFVVPQSDDTAMLSARISDLLGDPVRRHAMAARSLERAPEFTRERMVQRTLEVYEEALGARQ